MYCPCSAYRPRPEQPHATAKADLIKELGSTRPLTAADYNIRINTTDRPEPEQTGEGEGLLPCPFCDGKPYYTSSVNGNLMLYVGCGQCKIEFARQRKDFGPTPPELVAEIKAAWNSQKTRNDAATWFEQYQAWMKRGMEAEQREAALTAQVATYREALDKLVEAADAVVLVVDRKTDAVDRLKAAVIKGRTIVEGKINVR